MYVDWLSCVEATVFSPENMSSPAQNELHSDTPANADESPVVTLHMSHLDSSADDSIDHEESQAESLWVAFMMCQIVQLFLKKINIFANDGTLL